MATVQVHVIPNAKSDCVVGELAGDKRGPAIKIKLRAPAVEGKANAALVNFLAERLAVSRNQIVIERGTKSRNKLIRISGLEAQTVKDRLLA